MNELKFRFGYSNLNTNASSHSVGGKRIFLSRVVDDRIYLITAISVIFLATTAIASETPEGEIISDILFFSSS